MPSAAGGGLGVKLVTVAPDPRGRGSRASASLFDAATLAPVALVDGDRADDAADRGRLRARGPPPRRAATPRRLVVFGTGPQARAHVEAMRRSARSSTSTLVGRDRGRTEALARELGAEPRAADAWPSRHRLLLHDRARAAVRRRRSWPTRRPWSRSAPTSPTRARSTSGSPARATVVVESRATRAARGRRRDRRDRGGRARPRTRSSTLADAGPRRGAAAPGRPRLFKSTGMAWEDLVLAPAARLTAACGVPFEPCPSPSSSAATSRRPPDPETQADLAAPAARPPPWRVRRRRSRPVADLARPRHLRPDALRLRRHRGRLKAAVREEYGTVGPRPWAKGPHPGPAGAAPTAPAARARALAELRR